MENEASPRDVHVSTDDEVPYVIGTQLAVKPLNQQTEWFYRAKRLIDVVGAALAILVMLPFLPFVALAIVIDSGRPIFYSQQRVRSRRVRVDGEWTWLLDSFTFLKLRTMYTGSPATTHREYMAAYINGDETSMAQLSSNAPTYKLVEDPRVTRVGHWLRALSLDELPQLWNVLVGEMSLVGPRPPIPYEVAMYRAADMDRFAAPAGMTGLWQVSGRSDLSFDEMVALDTEYIRRQSIEGDLKILLKTLPAVLSRKGAG